MSSGRKKHSHLNLYIRIFVPSFKENTQTQISPLFQSWHAVRHCCGAFWVAGYLIRAAAVATNAFYRILLHHISLYCRLAH